MEDAFGIVLFVVVAIAIVAAVWAISGTGEMYRQIGRGGLSLRDGADRPAREPAAADPGLEAEVRQLVEARNARRLRSGKEPLDVDAEVQRQLRDLL